MDIVDLEITRSRRVFLGTPLALEGDHSHFMLMYAARGMAGQCVLNPASETEKGEHHMQKIHTCHAKSGYTLGQSGVTDIGAEAIRTGSP